LLFIRCEGELTRKILELSVEGSYRKNVKFTGHPYIFV
jgi:hypothetical protein